jgi:hypothetical protein
VVERDVGAGAAAAELLGRAVLAEHAHLAADAAAAGGRGGGAGGAAVVGARVRGEGGGGDGDGGEGAAGGRHGWESRVALVEGAPGGAVCTGMIGRRDPARMRRSTGYE